MARGLEALAALAVASEHFDTGIRLAGSAAALREASPGQVSPRDHVWLEKHLVKARAVLGVAGSEEARRQGAALSLDEVLACALEVSDRPAVTPSAE
jgi:hypothetical protein